MPSWASPHVWPRGPLTFFSRQRPTAQSLAPQTREGHRGPLAGPLAPLLASSPPRGNAYRQDQSRHFSEDFAGFSKHRHSSPRALAGGLRMQSLFRSMCAWNGVERALDARVASLFAPETARGRTHARQPFLAGGALLPIGLHDGLHRHAELGVNVRTSLRIWFAHWFAPRTEACPECVSATQSKSTPASRPGTEPLSQTPWHGTEGRRRLRVRVARSGQIWPAPGMPRLARVYERKKVRYRTIR
jgi:hypothetical protein